MVDVLSSIGCMKLTALVELACSWTGFIVTGNRFSGTSDSSFRTVDTEKGRLVAELCVWRMDGTKNGLTALLSS